MDRHLNKPKTHLLCKQQRFNVERKPVGLQSRKDLAAGFTSESLKPALGIEELDT